ncbi:MAG TPA: S8 family serine peptidase [Puia sp.]|nr:S8 family serine peptidase [Puia sp.]
MIKRLPLILTLMISMIITIGLHAQVLTDKNLLARMSKDFKDREDKNFAQAKLLAKQKGWFITKRTPNGGVVTLIGVDELGNPQYVATYNNIIAAATTRANQLWPGGTSGLNLSGSSDAVKGKIAIWDGGHPLGTHVELTGRITNKDAGSVEGHSTHTTGTMIATGINPIAKGMAFGAQQLLAYNFNNDVSEMTSAAPGLLISNHSYGFLSGSGWSYDGTNWDWYGDTTISKTDAFGFGYYDINAQSYDSIAYNAPYYLIDVAAGNARGYNGPAVDSPYLYNAGVKLKRSATLKNNPNFVSVLNSSTAKDALVVGAVNGIPSGYYSPNDVTIASFSSLGPTNDGRIKPDIVADGVDVTSTWNTSNTAYSTQSGTSMATPNVTGSLYLLQEYYTKLHPSVFMRSATLKGLAIHTADEAGAAPGPDYTYGWGLLDVLKGSGVITSSYNQQSDTIIESALLNGATYTFNAVASGKGTLVATLSWTDPPATPVPVAQSLHNTKAMLVNDLDMRITSANGAQVFKPWVLDPSNPGNAATKGDNFRDNVEKINVDSVTPGQTYKITITHKGTLARGQQAFSLLVSGIGGESYCTSAPTSSAGTRIDSVNISNIQIANPAGCTTYTDNTKYTIQIQPKQKLPVRIKLSSCDATVADKVVKIFIDYNNNGVFDANELAAQSGVINGNGVYTDTINIPSLTKGNTALLRIVAEETSDPSTVQACGSYGKGETQDFNVIVGTPTSDLALAQIVAPANGECSDDSALMVITIRNNGIDTISNVPVSAIVKNGSSTVATLNETYPGKIPPGFLVTYTFQQTFPTTAGTNYNVSSFVTSATDQNSANDTLTSTVSIAAAPAAPEATATVSGDTLHLTVTNPNPSSTYFWYSSATSDTALFATTDTILTLTSVPAGNTFYVGEGIKGSVGVKSKNDYPNGGSYRDSLGFDQQRLGVNSLSYTANVPLILKSVRLYTGNPGKITIMTADTVLDQGQVAYYFPALSSTTIDVYATSPTAKPGSRPNDPADNGAIFYLNLPIPVGKHVLLDSTVDASVDKTAIDNASIFRNNNVTGNPYPFRIPNVISITGNSVAAPSNFQNYYYYFYNMKVQTNDCIGERTAVSVSVPANTNFNIWPNPSHGSFNVILNTGSSGTNNISVELFDLLGRRCFLQTFSASGLFSTTINTGTLITGMYILSIKSGSISYKKKILITR